MAGRINFYALVRKIHLYAGLGLMAFVLMYFVTGFMMSHEKWFSHEQAEPIETTHAFVFPSEMNEEQLAFHLQDAFGLNGKVGNPRMQGDSLIQIQYIHPGVNYQVKAFPLKGEVVIREQPQNFHRTMVVFHRLHGYGGGGLYNLYVLMMDLSSLALILFAVSGVYLWLKLIKVKWLGWLVLAGSTAYVLAVVGMLMK